MSLRLFLLKVNNMNEIKEVLKKFKKCPVTFVEDSNLGWKLQLETMDTSCRSSLEKASQNLGPHGKKYLKKRIVTSNAKVKKGLDNLF